MKKDTHLNTEKYIHSTRCIELGFFGSLETFSLSVVCLDELSDNDALTALEHGFSPAVSIPDDESEYMTDDEWYTEEHGFLLCTQCNRHAGWIGDFNDAYCALCGYSWYQSPTKFE
ncbi:MAG TPA: hypothetical protein V6C65_06740 [Allocoleopsis sp.]